MSLNRTRQNKRLWDARPPSRAKYARIAWDWFAKDKCVPRLVWFHSFDGWEFWIAEFPDGETDEIEAAIVRASYVDEFTFRLNDGNVARHTTERLDSFVDATAGKRLTYKRLIR